MKAILKLKTKKLFLDWEFGYDKIPNYMKLSKHGVKAVKLMSYITYNIVCHK